MHGLRHRRRRGFSHSHHIPMQPDPQSVGRGGRRSGDLHQYQCSLLCERGRGHLSGCAHIHSSYENDISTTGPQAAEDRSYVGVCSWRLCRDHGDG